MLFPPLAQITVTSPYGNRTLKGKSEFHPGVDLRAPTGEPVYSSDGGVVLRSYESIGKEQDPSKSWWGYGHRVVIKHDSGIETSYAHLNDRVVAEGQRVERGDLIGHAGESGRSYGPHLHYEVKVNGSTVDPMEYIDAVSVGGGSEESETETAPASTEDQGLLFASGRVAPALLAVALLVAAIWIVARVK